MPSNILQVTKITPELSKVAVANIFSRFGKCQVYQRSWCFLVQYFKKPHAREAVKELNNTTLFGINGETKIMIKYIKHKQLVQQNINIPNLTLNSKKRRNSQYQDDEDDDNENEEEYDDDGQPTKKFYKNKYDLEFQQEVHNQFTKALQNSQIQMFSDITNNTQQPQQPTQMQQQNQQIQKNNTQFPSYSSYTPYYSQQSTTQTTQNKTQQQLQLSSMATQKQNHNDQYQNQMLKSKYECLKQSVSKDENQNTNSQPVSQKFSLLNTSKELIQYKDLVDNEDYDSTRKKVKKDRTDCSTNNSLNNSIEFENLTLFQLQDECKKRNIKPTGSKAQLVYQLQNAILSQI